MKRVLLPLLAALALPSAVEANWFGKYGSYMEADNACNKRPVGYFAINVIITVSVSKRKPTSHEYIINWLCLRRHHSRMREVHIWWI